MSSERDLVVRPARPSAARSGHRPSCFDPPKADASSALFHSATVVTAKALFACLDPNRLRAVQTDQAKRFRRREVRDSGQITRSFFHRPTGARRPPAGRVTARVGGRRSSAVVRLAARLPSAGSRPSGVNLSNAVGNPRVNLDNNLPATVRCAAKACSIHGPIACSSWSDRSLDFVLYQPRIGLLVLAALLEAVDKFAKPTTQHAARTAPPRSRPVSSTLPDLPPRPAGRISRRLLQSLSTGDFVLFCTGNEKSQSATMDGIPRLIFLLYVRSGAASIETASVRCRSP